MARALTGALDMPLLPVSVQSLSPNICQLYCPYLEGTCAQLNVKAVLARCIVEVVLHQAYVTGDPHAP